jgi:hypothetical protein
MRHRRVFVKLLVASVVVLAVALGAFSLFTEAWAGCMCPMIYAPVKCDNGRTYSNGCVAACAHAHNCVPVGPGPVQ